MPHRLSFLLRGREKDLLELIPLWQEDWFSAVDVLEGRGAANIPRYKLKATAWLANTEQVLGHMPAPSPWPLDLLQ